MLCLPDRITPFQSTIRMNITYNHDLMLYIDTIDSFIEVIESRGKRSANLTADILAGENTYLEFGILFLLFFHIVGLGMVNFDDKVHS